MFCFVVILVCVFRSACLRLGKVVQRYDLFLYNNVHENGFIVLTMLEAKN